MPKYGEILLGVGGIMLAKSGELLENRVARDKIKEYLLNDGIKKRNLYQVVSSKKFQTIIYDYSGSFVNLTMTKDCSEDEDQTVDLLIVDFFVKNILPKITKGYIDTVRKGIRAVKATIRVDNIDMSKIYTQINQEQFVRELKEFLEYNYIILSEVAKVNNQMVFKLILPIPSNGRMNDDYIGEDG